MDLSIIISQMITIFLMMLLGFFCGKTKLIDEKGSQFLSKLIVMIFNPAIIFSSVLSNAEGGNDSYIGLTFLIAAISFAILIITSIPVSKVLYNDQHDAVILRFMYIFSNLGFIGIPVINAMFGREYLIYVAVFVLEYNILFYTYRTICMTKKNGEPFRISDMKAMINPGTISCAATLIVFLTHIKIPAAASAAISSVGGVATPLALMVIGVSVGRQENILKIFLDWKMYILAVLKLLLIPIAGILLLKTFHIQDTVAQITTYMLGMPVGSMAGVFAKEYGYGEEISSNGIILSTLLSMITLPVLTALYHIL